MKTDIEIAHEANLHKIVEVANTIGINSEEIINYGKYIAKVPLDEIDEQAIKNNNLILVTAITPTKAGIGKTTISIGLTLGLNKIGKKAVVTLREPSLGPCFGMKGGAAGGGYAQVLPMENINLHFTGDFHAITAAHNMIAAMLDNYIYQNVDCPKQLHEVKWKRVQDVNDRNLRNIVTGLGRATDGVVSQSGFDITPASEIMAILCLSNNLDDLKHRIENIILGYTYDGSSFTVKDLGVAGAATVLLKDAMMPNLVQTIENGAALIHGGPFANIAHGCNSIVATKMAMSHSEYTVTEAGFAADLGAEKFYDIKCRKANLSPKLTVLVATIQALKMHGGANIEDITKPNIESVIEGLKNLDKHVSNIQKFGQTVVVAFNKYRDDTDEEIELVRNHCKEIGVRFAINNAFVEGGEGAIELAKVVVEAIENEPSKPLKYIYDLEDSFKDKVLKISSEIYGTDNVSYSKIAQKALKRIEKLGVAHYPVCIAKTQYSFTDNASAYGIVKDFELTVRDIEINNGAEMIIVIMGTIMRMPGLPKKPQANYIDLVDGVITGLS